MDRLTRFATIAFVTLIVLNFGVFGGLETSIGLLMETVISALVAVLVGATADVLLSS